jgi:signal transduction histidine kinase
MGDSGDTTPDVLIAEDNSDMRRLLTVLLSREFRVHATKNGREALEAVRSRRPSLVLTDVMMPEMSGTELCREIKSDVDLRGIPVVLITSKAEREMKVEGLELGADDYVTKPFHPRELTARVRSLVKLRSLQEEVSVQNALLKSTNQELHATLSELKEASVQLVQAERLAAVGELAAGVAHEINNPMNFATNALRTLAEYVEDVVVVAERITAVNWDRREAITAEVEELEGLKDRIRFSEVADSLAELVRIVTEGLERTHRLVGDLRDFASPGDGRRRDVDLVRGLETTVHLVRHAMREAGVNLRVDLPERLPLIDGDSRALNQVFLNLLKNAAEAFDGGGGSVALTAWARDSSVVVNVRDDGPGISSEVRSRIFEPFYSTKGAGKGTGRTNRAT